MKFVIYKYSNGSNRKEYLCEIGSIKCWLFDKLCSVLFTLEEAKQYVYDNSNGNCFLRLTKVDPYEEHAIMLKENRTWRL